jgi:hypothetical protein
MPLKPLLAAARSVMGHKANPRSKFSPILKSVNRPDEALALAKALHEAAAHEDALKIADTDLCLAAEDEESSVVPLVHWLRDYAGGMGRTAMALKAAERRSNIHYHWKSSAPSNRGRA